MALGPENSPQHSTRHGIALERLGPPLRRVITSFMCYEVPSFCLKRLSRQKAPWAVSSDKTALSSPRAEQTAMGATPCCHMTPWLCFYELTPMSALPPY